jgi:hypothetical protein
MNLNPWCARSCVLVVLSVSAATAADAQDKPIAIGAAYQLVHFDQLSFPLGANVDGSVDLTRELALVGEIGWSRNSSQQFGLRDVTVGLDAAAGVRWTIARDRRIAPFAQMLVGLERDRTDIERFGVDSVVSGVAQPGAGLAVRVATRERVFGTIDFRRLLQDRDNRTAVRVSIGVRFDLR